MQIAQVKTYSINKILGIFLALSLILHFAAALLLYKYPISNLGKSNFEKNDVVDVKIVSPQESRNILDELQGQIVDIVDNSEAKTPLSSQFLSDKNRIVSKETQALLTGKDPNSSFSSMGGGKREDLLTFKEKTAQSENSQDKKNGRIVTDKSNDGARSKGDKGDTLNLNPTGEELSRFFTIAPNNYLPNVEVGSSTLLNTREFAYAGFFVRMKRQLESIWDPRPVLSRSFLERKFPYSTSLTIVLGPKGELVDIDILQSSGVRELDMEAIRAVRQSAPFPNPPKELQSGDGQIQIPRFDFIIPGPRGNF